MVCLVRLFDGKIYIPTTCHNHLSRNEISCQAVFTKISLDYIPDELKDLKKKKKEKQLISKRMILKKEIMHGKGKFTKINGSICNIPIEAANIWNILARPADSNGLIVVRLKKYLKYMGYVYFKLIHPNVIRQALNYLKTHIKFFKNTSISESLLNKKIINFIGIDEHQDDD